MTASERLWELLPSIYRQRDAEAEQHGVLRDLIAVVGEQADVVAEDLAQLYDNWFIETCDDWVVAYIGDLLGVRPLHPVGTVASAPRAYVANTLAYRRRKGTPAVLEQLARDVTGWPAKVVEFFLLLETNQNVNHRRTSNVRTPDLRQGAALVHLGGPFDTAAHTVDVRRPPAGRYGIPDIGLFVWRLTPFRVARAVAQPVTDPPDGRYRIDPVGLDAPLFNAPLPERSITSLAQERHVPGPLSRRALYDELEALRTGAPPPPLPYFGDNAVLEVFADLGAGLAPVVPDQLTAANLDDPPPSVTTGWRRPPVGVTAAFDPERGRLAFRPGVSPSRVEVSYTYAFSGPIGAGPYDRSGKETAGVLSRATFGRAVGSDLPSLPGVVAGTLAEAITGWASQPPGTTGVIVVLDNRTYEETVAVSVPAGSVLLITSGVWNDIDAAAATGEPPVLASIQLDDRRPLLRGGLSVRGDLPSGTGPVVRGRLLVDGLMIQGDVVVEAGDLGRLELLHTTVVPGAGAVRVGAGNADLEIVIEQSICGPLQMAAEGPAVKVTTSILDGAGGWAVDLPQVEVDLDSVTVLGDTRCRALTASDCVFTGAVAVERVQQGCVRFSYVSDAARTPRRYRCQPDLALHPPTGEVDPSAIRARMTPGFTSTRFGDPGYAQLADRCANEILTGSSRRSDMGAFAALDQAHRRANLDAALDEYLRFGLEAGVFPVT